MSQNLYSRYMQLPLAQASDSITPGCLVLEGGAFRGVYSSGVLDVLMEEDINFSCTIGVSAGALNGVNYVAGAIGRSARVNLGFRHDRKYVGVSALLRSRSIIGYDFLFQETPQFLPLNMDRLMDPRRRFVVVATNCFTGETEYFEKGKCSDILLATQASASMPLVSRMVTVDGRPCLDGGCSVHIPIRWALEQGYEKIVVVRTRQRGFRRKEKDGRIERLEKRVYRNYPQFLEALQASKATYNRTCDLLDRLEQEGRIFVLAPMREVRVTRLEGDMEKLGNLYEEGRLETRTLLPKLREYLAR